MASCENSSSTLNSIQWEQTEHVAQEEITADSPGIQGRKEEPYKHIPWGTEGGTAEEVHHIFKVSGSEESACLSMYCFVAVWKCVENVSDKRTHYFIIGFAAKKRVWLWECVWMMAGLSSLTWPSLIGLCGWVRRHACCIIYILITYILSNQCGQVKPAITTHHWGDISCMAVEHYYHVNLLQPLHYPDL